LFLRLWGTSGGTSRRARVPMSLLAFKIISAQRHGHGLVITRKGEWSFALNLNERVRVVPTTLSARP
jgi:hypothetical protein